ncbi:hypothetical protein ABI161_11945, partial [Enterococcus faecium]
MKPNIKILDRIFLGRDTEVILIQHEEGFEVSIGIQKLQKPHYCNQLYKNFTDEEKARVFFNRIRQKSPILYRWVMNAVRYEGYR